MNAVVFDAPMCVRLILTLGHFFWQGTAILLLVAIAGWMLRRASADARYGVYVAGLAMMACCPLITFLCSSPSGGAAPAAPLIQTVSHPSKPMPVVVRPRRSVTPSIVEPEVALRAVEPAARADFPVAQPAAAPVSVPPTARFGWQSYAPHALLIYLLGATLMLVRLLLGVYGGQRLRRRSELVTDNIILAALRRQVGALGLRFTPAIAYCRSVCVPTVVGVLRPMILLPISIASGLTPEQIETLLTHELAHIRRNDHLVNLFQRVVEALLFFHPAVWVVSRLIRSEREHCCDDMVLAAGGQRFAYAESLVRMAELSCTREAPRLAAVAALGADGQPSQLHNRIMRLIGVPANETIRLGRTWPLMLPLLVLLAVVVVQLACLKSGRTVHDRSTSTETSSPSAAMVEQQGIVTAPFGTPGYGSDVSYSKDLYLGVFKRGSRITLLDSKVRRSEFDIAIIKVRASQDDLLSVTQHKPAWVTLADTSFSDRYDPASDTIVAARPDSRPAEDNLSNPYAVGVVTDTNGLALFGSDLDHSFRLYLGRLHQADKIGLLDPRVGEENGRKVIKIRTLSDNTFGLSAGKIGWVPLAETSFSDQYDPATHTIIAKASQAARESTPSQATDKSHGGSPTPPAGEPTTQAAEAASFREPLGPLAASQLIGVTNNRSREKPKKWWGPDGSPLEKPPYVELGFHSNEEGSYEFAIRVPPEVTCIASRPTDKAGVETLTPRDVNHQPIPDLRAFVLSRCPADQQELTLIVRMATAAWQKLESWEMPWVSGDPSTSRIDSRSGVVLSWPREERGSVHVELTHIYVFDAARLVAFDSHGTLHTPHEATGGRGEGIVGRVCVYDGLPLKDLHRLEFQRRPYDQEITFQNVSLRAGHRTQVRLSRRQQVKNDRGGTSSQDLPAAEDPPTIARPADSRKASNQEPAKHSEQRTLKGHVVEETGQPVAGARVRLLSASAARSEATTNADGSFELRHDAPMLRGIALLALVDDLTLQGFMKFGYDVIQTPRDPLRIVLKPTRRVSVQVVDGSGRPITAATVQLNPSCDSAFATQTNDDGKAELRLPADLKINCVFALKSGLGFDYFENDASWPPPREEKPIPLPEQIKLVLDGARRVRVRAVDSKGQPMPHVWFMPWYFKMPGKLTDINLSGSPPIRESVAVETDAAGIALFDWLPKKLSSNVTFTPNDTSSYCPDQPYVGAGQQEAEVTANMIRNATISGRVFLPDGTPARDISIQAGGRGASTHYGHRLMLSK